MDEFLLRDAVPADSPAVRRLVFDTLAEFGLKPDPAGTDQDLDDLQSGYFDRGGRFWVLVDSNGTVVGSCGLHPLDTTSVELRKMYLAPHVRGRGLGKRLLENALVSARAAGYRRVQLETASVLASAIALYARSGFRRLPRDPHVPRCDQLWEIEL